MIETEIQVSMDYCRPKGEEQSRLEKCAWFIQLPAMRYARYGKSDAKSFSAIAQPIIEVGMEARRQKTR